jgi:hypothetical protein
MKCTSELSLITFQSLVHSVKVYFQAARESKNAKDVCVDLATGMFNPLTPELKPSAQRCLPRFFTGDFAF